MIACLTFAPMATAATDAEGQVAPTTWPGAVRESTAAGSFLPLTLTPTVGATKALGYVEGGYVSPTRAGTFRSFAEARVWHRLALRVGARLDEAGREVGPSLGARLQLLTQDAHGLNGSLSVFYKAEGFTEPEGEIETVASFARSWGNWLTLASLAYGQDPEGRERDGEATLAALLEVAERYHFGVDARIRVDLGSAQEILRAHREPVLNAQVGPVANMALGPLALTLHGGPSATRLVDERTKLGVAAFVGLATAF